MVINRREFICMTAATLGTVTHPALGIDQTKPNKKIGVALLGLGHYSSSILAPALRKTQYCSLKGVITGTPSKISAWQSRYNIPDKNTYTYETMSKIADNDDIDVVYVVTPTSTHLEFAVAAANAGKHVWCEKPMAMTAVDCQKMMDVCAKNGVYLSIGYRMQHEPNTRAFAELSKAKAYGTIQSMSSFAGYSGGPGHKDNWRMKRKMGGGALYDMGVYSINGARFVSGMEPIAVKARIEATPGFDEVDASTYFTLKFEGGIEADCGTSVVKGFNHLKIQCDNGWYELSPMQSYSGVRGETSSGKTYPSYSGVQQALQMDNDALAILNKTEVLVPGIEGLRDIRIVEAALKSVASKSAFVEI